MILISHTEDITQFKCESTYCAIERSYADSDIIFKRDIDYKVNEQPYDIVFNFFDFKEILKQIYNEAYRKGLKDGANSNK